MNKVILTGNLTKDPELLETKTGVAYCRISLAVNRRNGETKETDFYNSITAWRGQAEVIAKHFTKGSPILIEGNISLRNYEDNNGVKRQAVEIMVTNFEFVGGKDKDAEQPKQTPAAPKQKGMFEPDDSDDDSPF